MSPTWGVWSGPDLGHGRRLVAVDRSVLREAHDMEGLFDGRSEAAEAELAVDLQHLLDDLEEDAGDRRQARLLLPHSDHRKDLPYHGPRAVRSDLQRRGVGRGPDPGLT